MIHLPTGCVIVRYHTGMKPAATTSVPIPTEAMSFTPNENSIKRLSMIFRVNCTKPDMT